MTTEATILLFTSINKKMRVLLLFPMADRQTGAAIKYAFESLGHKVLAVDAKRLPLNSYSVACSYKPDLVFCSRIKELRGCG